MEKKQKVKFAFAAAACALAVSAAPVYAAMVDDYAFSQDEKKQEKAQDFEVKKHKKVYTSGNGTVFIDDTGGDNRFVIKTVGAKHGRHIITEEKKEKLEMALKSLDSEIKDAKKKLKKRTLAQIRCWSLN